MNQDQKWIQDLTLGKDDALDHIYQKFRSEMILWLVRAKGCDGEVAKEIYQLSILILYEKVRSGKLTRLESSLKTYLFAIGKNKLREHRKRQNRLVDNYLFEHLEYEDEIGAKTELEAKMSFVEGAIQQMEEKCRRILTLFYFNRCSMKSIAEQLELASDNAAKMAKNRCLNRLRDTCGDWPF